MDEESKMRPGTMAVYASEWAANKFAGTVKSEEPIICGSCNLWFTSETTVEEYIYHLNDEDGLTFDQIAEDPLLDSIIIHNKEWYENLDKNLDKKAGENDD